ncbi:hypothetical protein KT99_17935 [Shewanella benthica KT99]|uniref:Uncharacterized protein n=1 Tax=Shewanella benthica KT99 TaxID=314608 RepID=A9DB95_9GAMM|nr:hypothetical protein KT99_17935 [Shewanella benthica KT99]
MGLDRLKNNAIKITQINGLDDQHVITFSKRFAAIH